MPTFVVLLAGPILLEDYHLIEKLAQVKPADFWVSLSKILRDSIQRSCAVSVYPTFLLSYAV